MSHEIGSEVFSLVFFLLSAMAIVEILGHYRFFDFIRSKIMKLGLTDFYQFLVIGSATGVVAMGAVKELQFFKYMKLATVPALLGYIAGMGVWLLQYFLHMGF